MVCNTASYQIVEFSVVFPLIANIGKIGFSELMYHIKEGDDFCIPFVRIGGSDENVYLSYECADDTAQSGEFETIRSTGADFSWNSPQSGTFSWMHGEDEVKCVNITVFKDHIYEEDEGLTCVITEVWTDFDFVKPETLHLKCGITIQYNDGKCQLQAK